MKIAKSSKAPEDELGDTPTLPTGRASRCGQRSRAWQALAGVAIAGLLSLGAQAQTIQYGYDSMHRLTRVQYPDGSTVDYVYDNLGNRLARTTSPASAADNPPGAVSAPGIANGAVDVSSTPVLSWPGITDPDSGDSVMYLVYFGTIPTPPLAYSGWETSWSPGQLDCFTTYYWQVVTRDNHNIQSVGPLWSFTTGDVPPLADFQAAPSSGLAPLTISFQDHSQYRCGSLASWQWDFNNDGQVEGTGSNPTFTFTAPGDYTVKLTVADSHGGLGTVVKTNFVSVLGPNIVDLVPMDLKIEAAGPYGNLVVSYAVTNTGSISLSGKWQWADRFCFSPTQVPEKSASWVASFDESQALPAGAWYRRTNLVPVMDLDTTVGQYLCLAVDGGDQLRETRTNNNVLAVPIGARLPDLVASGLSWTGQAIAGQSITVTYSITNRGALDIRGPAGSEVDFYDGFYFSTNATWDATATLIGSANVSGALPAGTGYTKTESVYLPSRPPGEYWLFLRANDYEFVADSDMSNNTLAVPISLGAPDLRPLSIQAPVGVASDARIDIVYTVTNQGNAAALDLWMDSLYLSTNSAWSQDAYALGSSFQEGPLGPRESYAATNSVRLPGWPAGTYFLILNVDSWGLLAEAATANNQLAIPFTLQPPAGLPDLVPFSLLAPASALPGASFSVVYGVTNSGPTPLVGEWFDELWLSTNAVWDNTAAWVGFQAVNGPVPGGGSYFVTNTVSLPKVNAGAYYLILQANVMGLVEEATTTNNDLAVPITLQSPSLLPDLAVLSLTAPALAKPSQSIQITYAVTNQGGSTAVAPWFDYLVLSTDTGLEGEVGFLGFRSASADVPAGSGYSSTDTYLLPKVEDGDYYVVLSVDLASSINESTMDNNLLAVPIGVQSSAAPTPTTIRLTEAATLPSGTFRFTYTNTPGVTFTVFSTTNLSLPVSSWTALGSPTEVSPGRFQFTDLEAPGNKPRFYRVRSP